MLFILDKSMTVQDTLSNNGETSHITPFFDDTYTSYLETGAETYQFSTLADTTESQHLVVGNYIAFQYEGEYKLFTITEIEETHDDSFIKTVYCEMAGLRLINKVIRPMEFRNTNLRKFVEEILDGTEWEVGALDIGLNNVCDIDVKDYTNAYSLLQTHVKDKFNGEMSFSVKIEGKVATKTLNIYANRGNFEGFRFSYDSNLTSITRKVNFDDLVTALIGVGNNGLTFKEVEAEDKPLNQDFITDESAYMLWNDNGSHIIGYEKFDTDSPQELLKLTRKKLQERKEPKIKYELNPELLGDTVKIGDTVFVVDNEFNPPIHLSARINELSVSLSNNSNKSCVLSNFVEINSNITDEMRQIATQLEGYVDSQFPIGGDKIKDDAVNSNHISSNTIHGTHIIADSIEAKHIQSDSIESNHIKAETIEGKHITSDTIESKHIKANSIEADHIQSDSIESNHISANSIQSGHISSNTITANHIQTGTITAGSGIIADGAIGNAQISNVNANKIDSGEIDTSKVKVKGENGFLLIENNTLYVTDEQRKIRVELGLIENSTNYGLIVRASDGQTIMLDHEGVHNAGITDGAIDNRKVSENANISGKKLDIDSVIRTINENGTVTIEGTKIQVGNTTLDVELSKQTNLITEQGKKLETQKSEIQANTNAIKLKVDNQVYLEDKQNMTSKLEKNTSEISTMKGQIALKVEQTDIENAKDEINQIVDSKINSAKSEIKVTTDGISQKVSSVESTTTTLSNKVDTANNNATSALNKANNADNKVNNLQVEYTTTKNKVSTLETNLNGITSRVGNVETKQTTVDGKVSNLETRMSTAESKITEDAITNTVSKSFYTKDDIDSKGYQTQSQVQQTVDGLEIKVSQSGGYNLIYNGDFKRRLECWEPNSDRWQYGEDEWTPNGRHVACTGELNTARTMYAKNAMPFDRDAEAYTLSYWINTSTSGVDGTTNPYRRAELTVYYDDGSASWHSVGYNQTRFATWEKHVITVTKPPDKGFSHFALGLWCRDTTKTVHYAKVMVEKGTMANEWTPNPNEIYGGITTIDNEGIKVTATNTDTYTEIDASSFRVSDNNGGTVAEFAKASTIPYLKSGTIEASNVYANNIPKKENYGDIHFIYVNGSTGNDTNDGSQGRPYKTVQRAIDDISDIQNTNVTIYVYNSVQGFTIRGFTGSGVITLSLQDSAVINGGIWLHGVNNRINIINETGSRKATLKAGLSIDDCRCVDIYAVTFRGTNSGGNNISIYNTNYCAVNSCDLGGLSTQLMCAIRVQSSLLWLFGCIGSNITDVVGQYPFSHVMMARGGTSNVPDYSNILLCNYDGSGRIQNWTGGTFTKAPSSGWNPAYTPTQKTQVWSFNKIWSDETLHGWSDRQELIQGYSSTWNTGRWTGYMQFTDGMSAIRSAISGGTNLSGRIYVQRTSSSGNSTGSKLCLYASDGTLITNSTTINRSQGVWVSLSSAIISKIASGAITYFYLKADSNNTATYFKCESNPKIEITYTK